MRDLLITFGLSGRCLKWTCHASPVLKRASPSQLIVKSGALKEWKISTRAGKPFVATPPRNFALSAIFIEPVFFDVQKLVVPFLNRGRVTEDALFGRRWHSIFV